MNPVVIRGKHYPSQASAARDLGIAPQAITSALERGNLEAAGLGRNALTKHPVTLTSKEFPNGKDFESVADFARYMNLRLAYVHQLRFKARNNGTTNVERHWGVLSWVNKPR